MRTLYIILFLQIIFSVFCYSQYDGAPLVFSGGTNYSQYLGKGEGDNHFKHSKPGFQFEISYNNEDNFEWVLWGFSHFNTFNYVESDNVPVSFWSPYYTEFIFYQPDVKNPLFLFFGYDYTRMTFPRKEKPDSHHNLTFGGGWNMKIFNKLYLQFKLKPYFVCDNSIGQKFGINSIFNIHLGIE